MNTAWGCVIANVQHIPGLVVIADIAGGGTNILCLQNLAA